MFRQKQGLKIDPVRGNYNQNKESNRLFPMTANILPRTIGLQRS